MRIIPKAAVARGFTLIELLVAVAIIGILLGLLLPAVQNSREAARFTQCRNKIRQLALGVHHHESQYKCLPDGGLDWFSPRSLSDGIPKISPDQNWGWMYQILPFIEEGPIYSELSDATIKAHVVPLFFCPSRRNSTTKLYLGEMRAMNDYAANGGIQTLPNAYWGNGTDGGFMARRQYTPKATMATIKDGLSTTLMLGEKSVNELFYFQASCADDQGWTGGWDWDVIRWGNVSPIHDPQADECAPWFGSVHQGGCMFAFGDGSIHTITYSVDEKLFRSLSHCADGSPLAYIE